MHGTARHSDVAKLRVFPGGTDLAMALVMARREGLRVVASTLAYWLVSAQGVLADAAPGDFETGTGLIAELFGLLTFVVLALSAHWSARRQRD